MGDAGEGLVDAEDRFQQFLAEREQEKQRTGNAAADPEKARKLTSLELARAEMAHQQEVTQNEIRRKQITAALADLDKKIAELR
jgi:hypothetical protein